MLKTPLAQTAVLACAIALSVAAKAEPSEAERLSRPAQTIETTPVATDPLTQMNSNCGRHADKSAAPFTAQELSLLISFAKKGPEEALLACETFRKMRAA